MKTITTKVVYSTLILTTLLIFSKYDLSPKVIELSKEEIYLEKILDSLRYEESRNIVKAININYDEEGFELSRDEGPYQLNNKNYIFFAKSYNNGYIYDPFDEKITRNIARQHLKVLYNILGSYYESLVAYNCGLNRTMKGAPYKSYLYANRILRRID